MKKNLPFFVSVLIQPSKLYYKLDSCSQKRPLNFYTKVPDSIHNVYNEICIKQKSQLRIQAALLFKVTMFEKPPKSLIFKTLLSHSVLKSHKSLIL